MTDRVAGYVVALKQDIREDDAAVTLAAIQQIKGVLLVEPIKSTPELHIAEGRARYAMIERISTIVRDYREDNR